MVFSVALASWRYTFFRALTTAQRPPYGVRVPRHTHAAAGVLLALAALGSACKPAASPAAVPRLPGGKAGTVLARALEASGGWDRWLALRDLGYINTLTLFDPFGNLSSQSIGWYMAPLHRGLLARMESIGLPNEVLLGVNGADTWIVRDGMPITESSRIELTRFTMVSNLFWFSLPFAVAEMPATVTDLGEADGDQETRWHRLKVVFEADNPGVPGEWFVLYFNTRTGLIERVHAKITAAFLRHELWVGKWLDYRDCNGLKKERQRQFFPADHQGEIIGNMVAEQLVERVQFNTGYKPESFEKPAKVTTGARVRAIRLPTPNRLYASSRSTILKDSLSAHPE